VATDFTILPAAPGIGAVPFRFARLRQQAAFDGFVVQFLLNDARTWVGNFQRGRSGIDAVVEHPNKLDVLVVAGGLAYVVDPITRKTREWIRGTVIDVRPIRTRRLVVLQCDGLAFEAIGVEGSQWRTPRLSFGGFKEVVFSEDQIRGFGWRHDDTWHAFDVSLETGQFHGGAFASLRWADAKRNQA
jgi:hypothetical protein